MKNFIQRAITGILFVLLLLIGIIEHTTFFCLLFAVITALALNEFYTLVKHSRQSPDVPKIAAVMAGTYLFVVSYLCIQQNYSFRLYLPYLLFLIYIVIVEIYKKDSDPLVNMAYTLFGQLYVALPFSLYNLLFVVVADPTIQDALSEGVIGGSDGPTAIFVSSGSWFDAIPSLLSSVILPLMFFVFIWINDTGAYLAGVTLGKHRLFERISPKKSWEGFVGGALLDVILAAILAQYVPVLSLGAWIGFALTVVIVGTYGDLWESLIKRTIGIKDSGTILPGHGGILDRFDSALLAIPAVVIYLFMINY